MAYAEEWQNLCSQLRVVPMESKIFGDVRSSLALSPMVEWLLRQERLSVSPHQLFDKALSIYHDAWMAFGAIGELLYLDVAGNSQRKTTAVLTSKLMPVLVNKEDPLGAQYHFWNYILQMISRPRPVTLFTLSFGHELIWQRGDWSDHKADQLGINVGRAFLRGIEQVDYCKRWSSSGNTSLGGLYK